MPTWNEYVEKNGSLPEWPYPILYDKENEVSADVLIIGGGVAGCHAAISAAREGAKVVIADVLIDAARDVAEAKDDWRALCARTHAHTLRRAKEIQRVARVHRDPFEPI